MCCLNQNVDQTPAMVHPRRLRPLEEVSNLAHEIKSVEQRPVGDKAFKNTPWQRSKTTTQKPSPEKKIKGTPWPRTKNTIKHSPLPEIKTKNAKSIHVQEMYAAHSRLSDALKHVDGMVETAERLLLSNQLSDEEARNFTSAFSNQAELLKEWRNFLSTAEGRRLSAQELEALTHSEVNSPSDNLGVSFSCLDNAISSSPLVPCSLQSSLFCLTPLDRSNVPRRDFAAIADVKAVLETKLVEAKTTAISALKPGEPQHLQMSSPRSPVVSPCDNIPAASLSSPQPEIPNVLLPKSDSEAAVSPELGTPEIISPPRSIQLKGPTPSTGESLETPPNLRFISPLRSVQLKGPTPSSGGSVETPPNLREHLRHLPKTPPSVDLQTPCIPRELVLRYPRSFGKMGSVQILETPTPVTPEFCISPPKTCKPLGLLNLGCVDDSSPSGEPSTPCSKAPKCFETPYATPGSVLPPISPVSLSRNLTPLVDEITASAIKRIGVKGLEEELWRKLRAWNIDSCLTGRRYVSLEAQGTDLAMTLSLLRKIVSTDQH